MAHRFYAPAFTPGDTHVPLPDDEAQHLVRVLRLATGTRVRVFNGRGDEFAAEVEATDRRRAVLRVGARAAAAPELDFPVVLAQSVLKGDGMDEVVRDAVMLGVTAIQPLVTARTEVSSRHLERAARADRWRRIAVSSAKQCGRAVVPEIRDPAGPEAVIEGAHGLRLVLVEPAAARAAWRMRDVAAAGRPAAALVCVGPEGGWTSGELDAFERAGARLLQLGGRTLRADAVATVVLPVLLYAWDSE